MNDDRRSTWIAVAGAYAIFGLALWQRDRHYPRPFLFLGVISYSIYLLHPLVYGVLGNALESSTAVQLLALGGGIAITIALSVFTYRYLEHPLIRLGRRAATGSTGSPLTPEIERIERVAPGT